MEKKENEENETKEVIVVHEVKVEVKVEEKEEESVDSKAEAAAAPAPRVYQWYEPEYWNPPKPTTSDEKAENADAPTKAEEKVDAKPEVMVEEEVKLDGTETIAEDKAEGKDTAVSKDDEKKEEAPAPRVYLWYEPEFWNPPKAPEEPKTEIVSADPTELQAEVAAEPVHPEDDEHLHEVKKEEKCNSYLSMDGILSGALKPNEALYKHFSPHMRKTDSVLLIEDLTEAKPVEGAVRSLAGYKVGLAVFGKPLIAQIHVELPKTGPPKLRFLMTHPYEKNIDLASTEGEIGIPGLSMPWFPGVKNLGLFIGYILWTDWDDAVNEKGETYSAPTMHLALSASFICQFSLVGGGRYPKPNLHLYDIPAPIPQAAITKELHALDTAVDRYPALLGRQLYLAIEANQTELIDKLIKKCRGKKALNWRNTDVHQISNYSPLHIAVYVGSAESVKKLVKVGANYNLRTSKCDAPLHVAATTLVGKDESVSVEIISALIAAGADMHVPDKEGKTPYQRALLAHRSEAVLAALEHPPAQANWFVGLFVPPVDNTAEVLGRRIYAAVEYDRIEDLKALVKGKAKHPALSWRFPPLIETGVIGQVKGLGSSALTKAGATAALMSIAATTAAAAWNSKKYDEMNYGPLHLAVFLENVEAVKLLIEAKVNVNAKTKFKDTPLHVAACHPVKDETVTVEIISLLLAAGADRSCTDDSGLTALEIAVKFKQPGSLATAISPPPSLIEDAASTKVEG